MCKEQHMLAGSSRDHLFIVSPLTTPIQAPLPGKQEPGVVAWTTNGSPLNLAPIILWPGSGYKGETSRDYKLFHSDINNLPSFPEMAD